MSLLAGFSWCFSVVIHDSKPSFSLHLSNALQSYKIILRFANFWPLNPRFFCTIPFNLTIEIQEVSVEAQKREGDGSENDDHSRASNALYIAISER